MTSIIIPAHNEATVIERTLDALLRTTGTVAPEIFVVCNGCTDSTADLAQAFAPRVTVLQTPTGSKAHALNLGDAHATSFPRIYLDADILVSETLIRDLSAALATDRPRVAYPLARYALNNSSVAVQAFYKTWTSLPYNQPGRIGVGVYALNREGRARFDHFPDIISDDGFIRGLFTADECHIVNSCWTIVQAPATLSSLIKTKTRSRLGLYQLRKRFPELLQRHSSSTGTLDVIKTLLRRPHHLPRLPVYLFVILVTRLRAQLQIHTLNRYHWERDDSSRQPSASGHF